MEPCKKKILAVYISANQEKVHVYAVCLMTFAFITCLSCLEKEETNQWSQFESAFQRVETCKETSGQFGAMFLATKPEICNMYSLKQSLQIDHNETDNNKLSNEES